MKNFHDLLKKINNTNMKNKSFASLKIKSLYTNIPVSECIKRLENHFEKTNAI